MINLPILQSLDISNYGLFPGSEEAGDGLHIRFASRITLIVGANGLGKTTLVNIMFRVLTGPYDIPGIDSQEDLGTRRLQTRKIPDRRVFADRVADGAKDALASLAYSLGKKQIIVKRRLSDLALLSFVIDGEELSTGDEDVFQNEITRLVGVWSFGDWVLLLRHIIFYFEERRALVWDASAQRQILRLLFLPAPTAQKWTEAERSILELDSRMRNLQAVLTREERALAKSESKTQAGNDVREQLQELETAQVSDQDRQDELSQRLVALEARRQQARLRHLKEEQERESRFRELERAKLMAIAARFPNRSETARYILAQLMTDETCLVCGSSSPDAADEYARRIDKLECVVCGADLRNSKVEVPGREIAAKRMAAAAASLQSIDKDFVDAGRLLREAEQEFEQVRKILRELAAGIASRSNEIDVLVALLPPEESDLHKQRKELASMRSRVEQLRDELDEKRGAFADFIAAENRALARRSKAIKMMFDHYAQGFLLEVCNLTWSPHKDRLGQSGEMIEFPSFQLEMSGTDFETAVRRSGPEQVSQSQREFIDLAFRMALMAVAGKGGAGTLIIDAPESSLDAVFVHRATKVLTEFARSNSSNRLVMTSNLVEGQLIPQLLAATTRGGKPISQVLDLFAIATPTAAVRKLQGEYAAVRSRILVSQK